MLVERRRVEEFALLTLNRPEALNALNAALLAELEAGLDWAAASGARALLVTGAGTRAFCAGADIAELRGRSAPRVKQDAERGQSLFRRLDSHPLASIALVNGHALGGGLELALACTFRVATPSATLGLPEIKLGVIPGYGGTQRLPRLVGEARALEMILTGRRVDAEEALRIGLVHRVLAGDPLAGAMEFARQLTGFSLPALRLAREAVQRALTTTLGEGLRIEADLSTLAFQLHDATEGTTAFLEKRTPRFEDR
jgi:enoyl-CoA hydratase